MNFLTIEDLTSLMKKNVINDLTENNYTLLNQLEEMSVGQIDASIGFKFATHAALQARNPYLIMLLIDVMVYHLSSRMTHVSMQEIVDARYEDAKATLLNISSGKIIPNLPLNAEPEEFRSQNLYITEPKLTSSY